MKKIHDRLGHISSALEGVEANPVLARTSLTNAYTTFEVKDLIYLADTALETVPVALCPLFFERCEELHKYTQGVCVGAFAFLKDWEWKEEHTHALN